MVWFERKVIAGMQNRIGPNKAGPWGILQTLADGIKFFFKEDLLPNAADRRVFKLRALPVDGAGLPGLRHRARRRARSTGHHRLQQLADPPIGILFLLAMSSIAVYGVMLAGWSSGSKYPLLGSVRASAQMVSYEAALGLSVAAVVLVTGSLSTARHRQRSEGEHLPTGTSSASASCPFVIFLIAATAELNRPPFDLVEAEQELVGRLPHRVLVDPLRALLPGRVHEHDHHVGDHRHPVPRWPRRAHRSGRASQWLCPILWFVLKLFVFLFAYVWLRATLPRFRYDQLMDLGWKGLIPLSLGWLLILAAIHVSTAGGGHRRDRRPGGRRAGVGGRAARSPGAISGRELPARRPAPAAEEVALMGYLDGFKVTFKQILAASVTTQVPAREAAQARALPRPPRPQPLRGRHGEVHRVRAVRRRVPGPVHLRARARTTRSTPPVSPGERYGFVYEINYLRCIHCDLCVEACPTEAITESKLFEFSFTNRRGRHLHQGRAAGRRRRPAPAPAVGGLARGRRRQHLGVGAGHLARRVGADFEGGAQWSGELGYGVRPPEKGQARCWPNTGGDDVDWPPPRSTWPSSRPPSSCWPAPSAWSCRP